MYKVIYTHRKNINGNEFNETILKNIHQTIESAAQEIVAAHDHAKALGLTQGREYEVSLLSEVA
jgi:hypothetical protein